MFFVSICGPWQGSYIEKRLFRADTQVGPYAFYRYYTQTPNSYFLTPN